MKWFLNFVYIILLTLLSPVILWRSVRHGRYRQGWNQKLLGRLPVFAADDRVVWFHAVSVGEVLQLQKLVEAFRCGPDDKRQVLITTSTDTGFALAQERFPDCAVSWFPLDFSWAVASALQRVKPNLVVLIELELWPNFLRSCSAHGVRTALVNARMSDRSFAGYSRIQWLVSPLFGQFSVVAAQTQEYANRLLQLGTNAGTTTVTGSVKFDGVLTNRDNPRTEQLRKLLNITEHELVFLAGSTQSPEEQLALDAWLQLRKQHPNLRLILVPRHRERFDEVADLLNKRGVPVVRRSRLNSATSSGSNHVILLDTIGELTGCWGLADIAFVGGSFGSRGGQNMLEPAAYGAAVLFGPNTWNFRDIVHRLLDADGARQLRAPAELLDELTRLVCDSDLRHRRGRAAQQFVISQQGAIQKTIKLLTRADVQTETDRNRKAA